MRHICITGAAPSRIIIAACLNLLLDRHLRKYSFETNIGLGSPNRSRRESINIMANTPRNSTFGVSSKGSILNELERAGIDGQKSTIQVYKLDGVKTSGRTVRGLVCIFL